MLADEGCRDPVVTQSWARIPALRFQNVALPLHFLSLPGRAGEWGQPRAPTPQAHHGARLCAQFLAPRPAHGGVRTGGVHQPRPHPHMLSSHAACARNHEPRHVRATGLLGLLEINPLPLERQSHYFLILARS